MKIRLDKVRSEPFAWEEELQVEAAALARSELVALSPVAVEGVVERADPGFRLRARVRYQRSLLCDRCLRTFAEPVDEELETLLVEAGGSQETGERQLSGDEFGVQAVAGEEFDSAELVLEQLQLGMPAKPLCRPDCAGICPACGADLANEPCRCAAPAADPRWQALAALKRRSDSDR